MGFSVFLNFGAIAAYKKAGQRLAARASFLLDKGGEQESCLVACGVPNLAYGVVFES